ncbi:MAG: DME family drug/metabolite transporter [Planctomycetota bacterium]|jgi:DME family drug/metabolite transporter
MAHEHERRVHPRTHRPQLYSFLSISSAEWAALACALIWAANGLLLRTQSEHVTPAAMNAIRCAVAGLAFWLVLPFDNTSLSGLLEVELAEWGMLFAALSLGVALGDTLYLIAIKEIGVSRTMALTGTFPLTTLFWQTVLLDAPFNPSLVLGSLLVVGGLFFLSRSGGGDARPVRLQLGMALSLIAALCWGFSATLLKPATVHMSSIQANAMRMPLIALLVFVVRVLPSGNETLRGIRARSLLIVGGTGLLGMGLGAYLFIYAITQANPAKVVTLTASSPLFGMLLAAIFLKEKITPQIALGMLLCLAGVYAVI